MSLELNANFSKKYEGIELQKCLLAFKKGINVFVRFQYSEIGRLENSTFHSQLKINKKSTPHQHLQKSVKLFMNDSKLTIISEKL